MADLNDIAAKLFGKHNINEYVHGTSPVLKQSYTITGVALEDSHDGIVKVELDNALMGPYQVDPTASRVDVENNNANSVTIPTTVKCLQNDRVIITVYGNTAIKSMVVTGVIGGGDKQAQDIEDIKGANEEEAVTRDALQEETRTDIDANKSEIEEAKNQIASDKKEIDEAMEKVNTDIANVQSDITEFKSTASTTYATKEEVNDKTGTITKTMTANYNDLSSKISSTKSDVDNLQIGGRNLIPQTKATSGYRIDASGSTKYVDSNHYVVESIEVEHGASYTLSIYIPVTEAAAQAYLKEHPDWLWDPFPFDIGNTETEALRQARAATAGSFPDRYVSLAWYDSNGTFISRPTGALTCDETFSNTYVAPSNAATCAVSYPKELVDEIKLEKGTKKSDWTPAPEDVNASVKDVQDDLNTYKDTVSKTYVEQSTYAQGVNEIKSEMGSHYTELTNYKTSNDKAVADAKKTGTDAQSALDSYKTTTDQSLNQLQNIADAAIETWTGNGVPTATNEPASKWNTDALKSQHAGDIYFDSNTGYAYRWDGTQWIYQKNTDITKALGDIETIKKDYVTKAVYEQTDTENKQVISDNLTTAKKYADGLISTEIENRNSAIDQKADSITQDVEKTYTKQTTFNAYKATNDSAVSKAQTDATNAGTAAKKAQTTADTANSNLSSFKTTVSETYATKSALKQTNDNISTEVAARKQTDTTISNLANNLSTNYSTTTEMNTAISQKADSITSSVNESISKAVGNIKIGGRNLIIQRDAISGYRIKTDGSDYSDANHYIVKGIAVSASTDYTLTTYISIVNSDTTSWVSLAWYDSNDTFISRPTGTLSVTNALSLTYKSPSNASTCRVSYPIALANHIKLEIGNKSTDWTPAPEDLDEKYALKEEVTSVRSDLQQTADSIEFSITTTQTKTDTNTSNLAVTNKTLSDEINTRRSFFRQTEVGGNPAMVLGSTNSKAVSRLTNEQLQFLYEDVVIAYISGQWLDINNARIHNELKLGGFAFLPRSNENLAFKWVGDN